MSSTLRRVTATMDWTEQAVARSAGQGEDEPIGTYLAAQTRYFPEIRGFLVYDPGLRPVISTIEPGRQCGINLSPYLGNSAAGNSYSDSIYCRETDTRIMVVSRSVLNPQGDTLGTVAAGVALLMVLLTLFLLRRLRRGADELNAADATVRQVVKDKEGLIRELLHRTNNSLQVVRSLVQLELTDDQDTVDRAILMRLDHRIGLLSLVQQMLREDNNYSWVPLRAYLERIRAEIVPNSATDGAVSCAVHCPDMELVLDAATPLGLIVGELFHLSCTPPRPSDSEPVRVELTVNQDEAGTISMVFTDSQEIVPDDDAVGLITTLAEHQLVGSVAFHTEGCFRCTLEFRPDLYRRRVAS